jgi:translation initiation factor RLI1
LLDAYDGVVVVVGHDRAFMDSVAEHLFVFEGQPPALARPPALSPRESRAEIEKALCDLLNTPTCRRLPESAWGGRRRQGAQLRGLLL